MTRSKENFLLAIWACEPHILQPCLRPCHGLRCCSPPPYFRGPASIVGSIYEFCFWQSDSKARFSPTTAVSPFNIFPHILPPHAFIFDATLSRSTIGEVFGPSSKSASLLEFWEFRESRKLLLFSFTKILYDVYTCNCKQHFFCLVLSQCTNLNTPAHGDYVTNITILGTGQTLSCWGQYTSKTNKTAVVELTTLWSCSPGRWKCFYTKPDGCRVSCSWSLDGCTCANKNRDSVRTIKYLQGREKTIFTKLAE